MKKQTFRFTYSDFVNFSKSICFWEPMVTMQIGNFVIVTVRCDDYKNANAKQELKMMKMKHIV